MKSADENANVYGNSAIKIGDGNRVLEAILHRSERLRSRRVKKRGLGEFFPSKTLVFDSSDLSLSRSLLRIRFRFCERTRRRVALRFLSRGNSWSPHHLVSFSTQDDTAYYANFFRGHSGIILRFIYEITLRTDSLTVSAACRAFFMFCGH